MGTEQVTRLTTAAGPSSVGRRDFLLKKEMEGSRACSKSCLAKNTVMITDGVTPATRGTSLLKTLCIYKTYFVRHKQKDSMAQWIRRWSTEPEILGSIPSGVVCSFSAVTFIFHFLKIILKNAVWLEPSYV